MNCQYQQTIRVSECHRQDCQASVAHGQAAADLRSPLDRALPTSLAARCVCGSGFADITRNLVKMKRGLVGTFSEGFLWANQPHLVKMDPL